MGSGLLDVAHVVGLRYRIKTLVWHAANALMHSSHSPVGYWSVVAVNGLIAAARQCRYAYFRRLDNWPGEPGR